MVLVAYNAVTQRLTTTVTSSGFHQLSSSSGVFTKSNSPQSPPRLRTCENGLKYIHYVPPSNAQPKGLVVIAAGGQGNMGPGSSGNQFSPANQCVFSVLARRLSEEGLAVCHLTWRNPSRPSLSTRSPQRVRECAYDIHSAVGALRVSHDRREAIGLPLVLLAHGAEAGAGAMAAAAMHVERTRKGFDLGPFAGVISLAPGLRVSDEKHDYGTCDTLGCLRSLASVRAPIMLIHGHEDKTSEVQSTSLIFASARGPKAAVILQNCDHGMASRFDDVLTLLLFWVPGLLARYGVVGDSGGQLVSDEADARLGLGQFVHM